MWHMVVGARYVGLGILETADLIGFPHIMVSRIYTEWWIQQQKKPMSEQQFCGRKLLMNKKKTVGFQEGHRNSTNHLLLLW